MASTVRVVVDVSEEDAADVEVDRSFAGLDPLEGRGKGEGSNL